MMLPMTKQANIEPRSSQEIAQALRTSFIIKEGTIDLTVKALSTQSISAEGDNGGHCWILLAGLGSGAERWVR